MDQSDLPEACKEGVAANLALLAEFAQALAAFDANDVDRDGKS